MFGVYFCSADVRGAPLLTVMPGVHLSGPRNGRNNPGCAELSLNPGCAELSLNPREEPRTCL